VAADEGKREVAEYLIASGANVHLGDEEVSDLLDDDA